MSIRLNWITLSAFILTMFSLFFLNSVDVFADNNNVYIEDIRYEKQGFVVKLSGKTPFQTVQVDEKQILVAVKGGIISGSVNTRVDNTDFIKKISFNKMPGNVVALVFYTRKEVKTMNASWLPDGSNLFIQLTSL